MQIFFNIIAICFRIFTNSFSNVFQKQLACRGEVPVYINFINYTFMSIFSVPLLFFTDLPFDNIQFWIYAAAGGICGAVCNCFMAMALKDGELSVLGPINSYKAILGLLFSMIILHEKPDIYGATGIILIIYGTYFILESPKDFFRQDIQYRIYALIFSAIEAVFIKKVILLSSVTMSFIISSFLGMIFSYFIFKIFINTNDFKFPVKENAILYFLTALCFSVMTFSTAYVFKYMNVGYALSLFQLSIILNVVLGYKLFREKNFVKKLFGSLIILIGSAIILIFAH